MGNKDTNNYDERDIKWAIETFNLHSREDAIHLLHKYRGKAQNKALLSRMNNQHFIESNPKKDFGKEMSQVSEVRFDAQVDSDRKVSELGFSWKNYDIFFDSKVPPETRQRVRDDLRKLERKGVDLLKVSECKLLARRKKKSITLPKVQMCVLWSMSKDGHLRGTFFTGTFSNSELYHTSPDVRRTQVRKWAESQGCEFFIINRDYGKRNGREHYHILFSGHVDVESYRKTFHSRCFVEEVYGDEDHISYYLTKLTNHAIKESVTNPAGSSMMVSPNLRGITSKKQVAYPLGDEVHSDSLPIVNLSDGHFHYANGDTNDEYCHNYEKDTLDLIRGRVKRPSLNRLRGDDEEDDYNELHILQEKYAETD